jgi:hypothetical protein
VRAHRRPSVAGMGRRPQGLTVKGGRRGGRETADFSTDGQMSRQRKTQTPQLSQDFSRRRDRGKHRHRPAFEPREFSIERGLIPRASTRQADSPS